MGVESGGREGVGREGRRRNGRRRERGGRGGRREGGGRGGEEGGRREGGERAREREKGKRRRRCTVRVSDAGLQVFLRHLPSYKTLVSDYNQHASLPGKKAGTYWVYCRCGLLNPDVGCDLHRVRSWPERERVSDHVCSPARFNCICTTVQ